jgi:uncharacterized protein
MAGLGKRFRPLDDFRSSLSGSYHLLPSRFISLDSDRYVLTNEVGEYTILKRQDLERFVRHDIQPQESLYEELKSKHFLFDAKSDSCIDLLVLKRRTKSEAISHFTALHIFVVTLRCDYSCQYCQVSRQSDDKTAFDMSRDSADRSLDHVFQSPSRAIKIEFQGGEPLLNFSLIRYIVEAAEIRNKIEKRTLQFVITTNLSLLGDEVISFCREHDIYISTSLDGPQDLHNSNRPKPGKNGYELSVNGIKRIQRELGKDRVSALMTTTGSSLNRVHEIIDTYVGLELDYIFLRSLSPYGFAVKTGASLKYQVEQWLAFWKKGLDYILDVNRQGYRLVEANTALVLDKIFSPFGTSYVDLQSPSGIAISAIVYNYDGDVYTSDEGRMLAEMGDKKFRLGNVHQDSYQDIFLSDTVLDTLEGSLAESSPMCSECGFLSYCGSDPVYHYATQGDVIGHKAKSGFCKRNMEMFRHVIRLIEDDPAAKEVLMTWVRW